MRFYDLRHGFATRLLETGTREPETRSYMLGHRLKSMTGVYTHISFDLVRNAIRALPSIISNGNTLKVDNGAVADKVGNRRLS